ncbi:putative Zn-dependent peptidase [Caldicellulosiruptor bescii]|uniref:Peptidase M16 domain protein n=4 Tax=Caldicellulosiruptor bescii TaxID=31899 RepID=B9MQ88_CALBD|nr:pitrilysin family protein [Caldicellulosiruptor bescii]ACM59880.1 peptidase M16 domain protein [Caldicellulosiruptor bescii DSM 6725]PBC87290.1 putative Zn-dependent peptidase [Caldicellulosiruptor bescii]PBC90230.1 putative Zn-dependent peptidase [Caldicellulosiruptor bescii]PBD04342.1 putative Zn-dependent peptidase [Caldicellulosiruptor bescii]PBD06027.1 putative Zn-dependent peptidase [Caldicellulosiruptor bescii]
MQKKEKNNNFYMAFCDDRFKINRIAVTFIDRLEREKNTLNALFPMVLIRGNNKYKDMKEINRFLDNMYGASLSIDVDKKGDLQAISFAISFLNDRFAGENLYTKALQFLYDIIYGPIKYGGGFEEEAILQEKNNLKQEIEGRINDKVQYAIDRCIEIMFEGQNYALYEKGNVDDLQTITKDKLFSQYQEVITKKPMYVFVYGDYDEEWATSKALEIFGEEKRESIHNNFFVNIPFENTRYVTEEMEVNQGKIALGIRTNVDVTSEDYYKLLMLNGILGASPKSKLFENVREKASLCYYVFSRIDRFKSVMIISSGIEIKNYEKALNLILQQIEDIKNGKIDDIEYESAINYYKTALMAIYDSPRDLLSFYLNQALVGQIIEPKEVFENLKNVNIEDIKRIANRFELDTVYFLKNRGVAKDGKDL